MLHEAPHRWGGKAAAGDAPPRIPAAHAPFEAELVPATAIPAELREQWQALAGWAAEPNSFAEPWFVEASLRHFAPRDGAHLLIARSRGELVGTALFCTASRYGRTPVRHVENWRHHNQFLGAPLIRRGAEADFWRAALEQLDAADWASGFLHVTALAEGGPVHRGLVAAAASMDRACPVVHRERRPLLHSDLSPEDYFERNVSKKRRSEYRRLRSRLAEAGRLELRSLEDAAQVGPWSEEFLALESAGWKGEAGSALACAPATAAFFREAIAGAFAAGRLSFLRLDVDRRPIAMLTSFLAPPGAFGFKSAIDPDFARYSPGMLLQIDNLAILDQPEIEWMDSCASEQHPVASLWSEWRDLVRVSVRLSGFSRGLAYSGARLIEEGARLVGPRRRSASLPPGRGTAR